MYYFDAQEKLDSGIKKNSKRLENNTYLVREGNNIAVRLHETNIITLFSNGSFVLDSGGWKTPTTKDRINKYIPMGSLSFGLVQEKSVWYLVKNVNGDFGHKENSRYLFQDGMKINSKGNILKSLLVNKKKDKKNDKLKKQIAKYCNDYMEAFKNGKVNKPSTGDCFFCVMRTEKENKPLGEVTKDKDHILSHLKESYFVPSLLMRAIEVFPISLIAGEFIYDTWENKKTNLEQDFIIQQIKKPLSRYLKRQLDFAG